MQPGECGDTPPWAVSYSCTSQSRDCQNPCPEIDQRGETSSSVNQSLLRQGPTVLQLEQLERQRHPELRRWSCTGGGQSQQPQRFVYLTDLGKGGRYLAVFTFFFFLLDMPCGVLRRGITLLEGLLLPFCSFWLSLTCTFPG